MTPEQNVVSYPVFGDNSSIVKPDDAKYSAGFIEADVLPAEYLNYFFNKASSAITVLNALAASLTKETINVLDAAGKEPASADNTQLLESIRYLINTPLSTHAALTGSSAHGATSEATASQIITRDASGRAQVADPDADADIATKNYVDAKIDDDAPESTTSTLSAKFINDALANYDKTTLGSGISVLGYTSASNAYTTTSDGYIYINQDITVNSNIAVVDANTGKTISIAHVPAANVASSRTIYVKKGYKFYISYTANNQYTAAIFYPFVS